MVVRTDSQCEPHLMLEYTDSEWNFAVFASMRIAWRQGVVVRPDVIAPLSLSGNDQ